MTDSRTKHKWIGTCVVLLAVLATPRNAGTLQPGEPSAGARAFEEFAKEIASSELTALDPSRLTKFAQQISRASNDSVADAVSRGDLHAEVTATGTVPLKRFHPALRAIGLKAAVDAKLFGGEGSSATLSMHDMFEGSVTPNFRERTLGITFTLKTPESGIGLRKIPPKWRKLLREGGGELQIVTEMKFRSRRDMLVATGADLGVVPLFPTTRKLTENIIAKLRGQPAPNGIDPIAGPQEMIAALVPEMLQAPNKLESMKTGIGLKISGPAGNVTVRRMTQHGSEDGKPTSEPFVEVAYGKSVKKGVAGFEGKLGASLSYSTAKRDPQPEAPQLAEAIRKVGVGKMIEAVPKSLLPFELLQGRKPGQLSVASDPKVGGVMIRFDASALQKATGAELQLFEEQLRMVLEGKSEGFALRLGDLEERFETLSLSTWLDSGNRFLGNLTRVRGYILKGDDLILVGQAEQGRPKIHADLLIVAVASIYRDGTWPFVSLDPDPANVYGAQNPRVGGLPKEHRESEFVRIMLDADYDMKRVTLGELDPDIPGFRSEFDLLEETKPGVPETRRFWLAPAAYGSGSIHENRNVLVFDSEVEILTEQVKQAGELIVSSSRSRADAGELAADYMTRYYAQLEQRIDSFYQLHGLFDLAKLCAILRYKKVEHPLLDAIARKTVRTAKRPDGKGVLEPYLGIGPKVVPGTMLLVGGGASARQSVRKTSFVHSEVVGQLLEGKTTLSLEPVVPLPRESHPELLVATALRHLGSGDASSCVDACNRILDIDEHDENAYVLRALALLDLDRPKQALDDLNRAVRSNARLTGLRGVARLRTGDVTGAIEDVDEAVSKFPDDEAVCFWNGYVKAFSMDLAGARQAVERLTALNPTSEQAQKLLGQMLWMHRLDKEHAKQWSKAMLDLPFSLVERMEEGYAALEQMRYSEAVSNFRRAVTLSEQLSNNEAVREFHALERSLLGLAQAEAIEARFLGLFLQAFANRGGAIDDPKEDKAEPLPGLEHVDRLIELRPDWPSGYFCKALCALIQPKPIEGVDPKSLIDKGLARVNNDDPLWAQWKIILGDGDPARTMYAIGLQQAMLNITTSAGRGQSVTRALRGKLPTPYIRELAKEKGMTGKMAKALWPIFELLELDQSTTGPAARPGLEGQKKVYSELMHRILGDDGSKAILQKIQAAKTRDELEKPVIVEYLRFALGEKHGKAILDKLREADSLDILQRPETLELLVESALGLYRDTYEQTRNEQPSDLASCVVFSLFSTVHSLGEAFLGDRKRAMDVAHAHLKRLPVRANTLEGNNQLGYLRYQGTLMLAITHVVTAHHDLIPDLPTLFGKPSPGLPDEVAKGTLEPAEFVARIRARDRRFLERLRKENSKFTYELLATFLGPMEQTGGFAKLLGFPTVRRLCKQDKAMSPQQREKLFDKIDREDARIGRELTVAFAKKIILVRDPFTTKDRDEFLAAVRRGDDPKKLFSAWIDKLLEANKSIPEADKAKLRTALGGNDPGLTPKRFERSMLELVKDVLGLVDFYAIWNPAIEAADAPAELQSMKPLLQILDVLTTFTPAVMTQFLPGKAGALEITNGLFNSLTAGKARTYERVRAKTIRFQREALDKPPRAPEQGREPSPPAPTPRDEQTPKPEPEPTQTAEWWRQPTALGAGGVLILAIVAALWYASRRKSPGTGS